MGLLSRASRPVKAIGSGFKIVNDRRRVISLFLLPSHPSSPEVPSPVGYDRIDLDQVLGVGLKKGLAR